MFADPAFDHADDDLRGAGDVDLALGVARRLDRLGDLAAEAVAGQADHAHAVDRAVEMAREPRQQRIGLGAAAEERHLARRARNTDRPACRHGRRAASASASFSGASRPVGDQFAHAGGAGLAQPVVDGRDVRPPIQHGAVDAVGRGGYRRQLPIGEMGGKDQRRLAVMCQPHEALDISRVNSIAARPLRVVRVEIPQPVEMGEFGAHAAEIVPDAAQDRVDLGGGFFRESGGKIVAADRFSGSSGPIVRISQPAKSAIRSGSMRRRPLSSATASAPSSALPARLTPRRRRRIVSAHSHWANGAHLSGSES